MSSIQTQFLNIKAHHSRYPGIDPKTALIGSASGKIMVPERILFLKKLPKGISGKIQRAALKQLQLKAA
jgi:acyl-coenzyme A synthetase/AMP-(fatty) acid ligase